MAEVEIRGPYQLLDFYLLGDRSVAELARPGRLNTDDRPSLEFLAPRTLHRATAWLANFQALRSARGPQGPPVVGRTAPCRWAGRAV